jgi:hypothetical protein
MSVCGKAHSDLVSLHYLPRDQGGHGRHRCAGCAYEKGYAQGAIRSESMTLGLDSLDESPAGILRYRSPHAAFALGYLEGVQASYSNS